MTSPKQSSLTKGRFHEALKIIDSFVADYYKKEIKIHINDSVLDSIKLVRSALKSLLFMDEQDVDWASSTIAQVKKLNAERAIDFDDKDEEVRKILTEISLAIRDYRNQFRPVLMD